MIAVAAAEAKLYGCPHCGFRSGSFSMQGGGTGVWNCGECGAVSLFLSDGLEQSTIGLGGAGGCEYPTRVPHPRIGTPAHGTPDRKPYPGGEFFASRGIGKDWNLPCFVCGVLMELSDNIAAFVRTKEAGERVVEMFGGRARLDFREYEPDRIQVKVGACAAHASKLQALHTSTRAADCTLNNEIILRVIAAKTSDREIPTDPG